MSIRTRIARALAGIAAGLPFTPARPPQATASFDAAGQGRRMAGWKTTGAGPNASARNLSLIRNRARDAQRNEWTAAAAERIWGTNLVGTGIICRPVTEDLAQKARFIQLWDDWAALADHDGVLDFYGLQTLVAESWRTAGEVFAVQNTLSQTEAAELGLKIPLQIRILEAEMLPLLNADAWPGLPDGHRIRSGIELTPAGRRGAYWMHREHPGEFTASPAATQLLRVPAEQVRHIYRPARPGQLRGLPSSTAVIARRRSVGNFDDAVLHRQELANLYAGFIERPADTSAPAAFDLSQPTAPDDDFDPKLEPGMMQELAPGETIRFSEPPDAGANYSDFMRHQHLGIAAGEGIPYELLTGDLRDISDRAMRVMINDFRRTCEQYQWQILIPQLCTWTRAAVTRAALLAGVLTPAEAEDFRACTWHPHAWPYIHPLQDVQARRVEKDAGLKSRAQLAAERGEDIEQIDAERAADADRERALGLQTEDKTDARQDPRARRRYL